MEGLAGSRSNERHISYSHEHCTISANVHVKFPLVLCAKDSCSRFSAFSIIVPRAGQSLRSAKGEYRSLHLPKGSTVQALRDALQPDEIIEAKHMVTSRRFLLLEYFTSVSMLIGDRNGRIVSDRTITAERFPSSSESCFQVNDIKRFCMRLSIL